MRELGVQLKPLTNQIGEKEFRPGCSDSGKANIIPPWKNNIFDVRKGKREMEGQEVLPRKWEFLIQEAGVGEIPNS